VDNVALEEAGRRGSQQDMSFVKMLETCAILLYRELSSYSLILKYKKITKGIIAIK
jgi:hypothetical protein